MRFDCRIFILFLLLTVTNLTAQYNDLGFRHITPINGLSQGTVKCFMQDDNGFIWVGTRNGLNRFDGYDFTVFKNIPGDNQSLSNNHVTDLKKTKDEKLWIATWGNGINLFDLKKQKFSRPFNSLENEFIHCILEDHSGNLWIGTDGNGLFMYDFKMNKLLHFIHDPARPGTINDNTIRAIYEDTEKNIWIGTQHGGLNLFNRKGDFSHKDNPGEIRFPAVEQVRTISEINGRICLGSYGKGLFIMDNRSGVIRNFLNNPDNPGSICHNNVISLEADRNGYLWIGTENGGISIFDPKTEKFRNFRNDPLDNSSLNNNSVYSIFEDKSGNIWAGTWNGGINLVQKDARQFTSYSHNSSPASLSDNHVLCILEDSDGYLWIGTDGGGLNMMDPATGKFTHFLHQDGNKNSIAGNFVLSVCEDKNREIWIGTYGNGISIYNKKTRTFRHMKQETGKKGGISSNYVWVLNKDSRDRIWIGMCPGGVNMFDPASGKISYFLHEENNPNSLSHNNIHSIFEDSRGNVWIGTNGGGLNKIENQTGKIVHYNVQQGLSHSSLGHLYEDEKHNLWIGTDAGLDYMDTQTGRITNYGAEYGIPNCFIYGILEDRNRCLWISSNEGLIRFDVMKKQTAIFSVNDGLQSNEFNLNAFCKSRSGEMYFGGSNGFDKFIPEEIKMSNRGNSPVFTDFFIFNRSVETDEEDSPLQNHISYTKNIILPYSASVISFEFAVLNYRIPGNNHYAYKMEGFDKDWNYVKANRTATYTNLDPGSYTLKVSSITTDNPESDHVSLKIIIRPPFWKTVWFNLFIIIIFITGILVAFRLRLRVVQKQNLLLEEKVNSRTSEIREINNILQMQAKELKHANRLLQKRNLKVEEQTEELTVQKEHLIKMNNDLNKLNATKDKFFSIIAHDIKNPFNAILGFSNLLKANFYAWNDEKKLQIIDILHSSSQNLFNLLENLLQWSRTQRDSIEFNPEFLSLKDILNKCYELIDNSVIEKKINYSVTPETEDLVIYADRQMIYTVFRNLIGNAVKFTYIGGNINISSLRKNGSILISVSDDGIGIPADKLEHLFKSGNTSTPGTGKESGTGLGLMLSNEFIIRHSGTISVQSEEGKGSIFTIEIPHKND